MIKHLQNIAAVIAIIVGAITIYSFLFSKSASVTANIIPPEILSLRSATLTISGSGVDVLIKKGESTIRYKGGTLSSSGTDQTIYIPLGQKLNIIVSGAGTDIGVEKSIAQYINISSSGAGTKVYEF